MRIPGHGNQRPQCARRTWLAESRDRRHRPGQSVDINGCVQGGGWCTVAFSGGEGWVSSRYLSGDLSRTGSRYRAADQRRPRGETVPATGSGRRRHRRCGRCGHRRGRRWPCRSRGRRRRRRRSPAEHGHRPRSADARAHLCQFEPDAACLSRGEVVVGSSLPDTVELREIPDYEYRYVYVNDRPMLVEPGSRRVVYVIQ